MKKNIPILKTRRLILRELWESDLKGIQENLNDLEVSKQLKTIPYPCTQDDSKDYMKYYTDEYKKKNKENYGYGIEYNKRIIGMACLHMINKIQMNCFLDYWIGKKYWRKGIGFEACTALIDFTFKKLGLKTIESSAFADNIASQKLLEKLHFKKKHLLLNHAKSQATGEVHDLQTFLLTKEDWIT